MTLYSISIAELPVSKDGEDGPYEVPSFSVTAASENGKVFIHCHQFETADEALGLADRVQRRADEEDGSWEPSQQYWGFWRIIYGSKSWDSSCEHDLQRIDVEAEYGPGSYSPSHPGYLKV